MMAAIWRELLVSVADRLGPHVGLESFVDALAPAADIVPCIEDAVAPLPVARHWSAALCHDPLGALVGRFAAAPLSRWRQNPNYVAHPPTPDFLDNYGYLEWLGPVATYRHDQLRFGLLLLGPRTHYPRHHHPAEEVYLPLGPGRWFKDGEDWRQRRAGDVIHHPPHCGHATQSGDEPLAALYLWRGEIAKAAEIG